MAYRVAQVGFLACVLICQPSICAQDSVRANNAQGQGARDCLPSSFHEHPPGPEVTVAELIFEGDLRMPVSDQDEIAASLKQRTYRGELDAVVSEVEERVRQAWQNHGYFKVQARADGHQLTSSPTSEQIEVTAHIQEGQQYRLEGISFKGNQAISNVAALRSLFSINDGDVFDRAAIGKGLDGLSFAYGQYGYINFTSVPETRFNEENQTISLGIDIDEGKQFYVSKISILGADHDLLKDSFLQPGDSYNQRLARLFIQKHAPSPLIATSPDSHIHRQLDERAATVAITYDFRDCSSQGQQ